MSIEEKCSEIRNNVLEAPGASGGMKAFYGELAVTAYLTKEVERLQDDAAKDRQIAELVAKDSGISTDDYLQAANDAMKSKFERDYYKMKFEQAETELQRYQNSEQQKMPFVGDTVWYIRRPKKGSPVIYEMKITKIVCGEDKEFHFILKEPIAFGYEVNQLLKHFGKTVHLTKEAAERAKEDGE